MKGSDLHKQACEQTATAGVPATSVTVSAAAAASGADVGVWAKADDRWALYLPNLAKPRAKVVWVKLENRHYQWLKPKTAEGVPKEVLQLWQAQALPYPTDFTGGGGRTAEEDARSLLGLARSRSKREEGDAARSLLGLSRASSGADTSDARSLSGLDWKGRGERELGGAWSTPALRLRLEALL